jgi:hypothetical protein
MFGPGNNVVVIEAVKEETKGRQEEVRAGAENTGAGLREWIIEEAAWLFTQFMKVALSVAVVRGVHQLFRIGFASEAAYQRAPDLWTMDIRTEIIDLGAAATLIQAATPEVRGKRTGPRILEAQRHMAAVSTVPAAIPLPKVPAT